MKRIILLLFLFFNYKCTLDQIFEGLKTKEYPLLGEKIIVPVDSNVNIYGFYLRPYNSSNNILSNYTIIFNHGILANMRANDISSFTLFLHNLGTHLIIYDYESYGKSGGKMSESNSYRDAYAIIDYAVNNLHLDSNYFVYAGFSLGTGIAVETAINRKPRGLILFSAYTSMDDMVEYFSGHDLPAHWFISYKYDNYSKIERINIPVYFVHGVKDEVVPLYYGKKLYEKARQPKYFFTNNGGHFDVVEYDAENLRQNLIHFISNL